MSRTIVVGYDGSDCSEAALRAALSWASEAAGSRIVVVHGHYVPWEGRAHEGTGHYGDAYDAVAARVTERIAPQLADAVERIVAAGVKGDSALVWENGPKAVLEVAAKESADLIVVGSHGEGGIEGALLGSTAFRLLHHSTVPVLVVPYRC